MITSESPEYIVQRQSVDAFLQATPFFDEKLFTRSMAKLFTRYMVECSEGRIEQFRPILSDGHTRALHTIFENRQAAGCTRTINSVTVNKCSIDRVEVDGHLYLIYLHIEGFTDVTEKGKMLKFFDTKRKKRELINRYWIMYRSREGKSVDLLHCRECPSCGHAISSSVCGNCGSKLNSGKFGWVLSRDISEDDLLEQKKIVRSENLSIREAVLSQIYPEFTVHALEDKVYNCFMQVITARLQNEPLLVRPIFSDRFYEREAMAICDNNVAYRHLQVNTIALVAVERLHGFSNIFCNVSFTAQRVDISKSQESIIDNTPIQRRAIFHLVRREPYCDSGGNLYEGSCPGCSMPVHYEVDPTCPHCSEAYNSARTEWIIVNMLSYEQFESLLQKDTHRFQYAINPRELSSVLSIRDYVLNNIMVMCAVDRVLTTEEMQFIDDAAVTLGYSEAQRRKVHKFLQGNGSLRLRLPENVEDQKKVLHLMIKAASADNKIAPEEEQVLSYIRSVIARGEAKIRS